MTTSPDKTTATAAPTTTTSSQTSPAKKRRRTSPSGGGSSSSSGKKKSSTPHESTPKSATAVAPANILLVDNGGDTIKYGWLTDSEPKLLPNKTARLQHQWTVLVADEIDKVQNPSSLYGITRSTERGMITNLGNQTQVWKRMLDQLGVTIPLNHSEAANSLGWKVAASRSSKGVEAKTKAKASKSIPSHSVAVVLLLPPYCPRVLLDQIINVWMDDFGVARFGLGISSVMAAQEHPQYKTSCVVDVGWSHCQVIPTFRKRPITPSWAIRRVPIGGRHLINILKYYASYRQYNLMDQEQILKDVLERLAYVSLEFSKDLELARRLPSGKRPYDRDYILPNYQTTTQGTVRLPLPLIKLQEQEQKLRAGKNNEEEEEEEENDEDYEEDCKNNDEDDEDDNVDIKRDEVVSEGSDDDEETEEQIMARVMRQRADEERRKREKEEEEQSLRVSVERFTIPEVLFRPMDAGLPKDLVGLHQAIFQSIQACPEPYKPALYRSIYVTGGLSQLPDLKARLERELRSLIPCEFDLDIKVAESPIHRAWLGAKERLQEAPHIEWSISKAEWEAASKRKAYSRLLISNEGWYV